MEAFFRAIIDRLREVFNPETLGGTVADFTTNVAVGALTFTAFYALWRGLNFFLGLFLRRSRSDATTASFLKTALKYTVLTTGLVNALTASGIDTGAIVASLGLAGLTIGFAARDALSNLISGLLIFWDRPFVIGDLVEVGDDYGRVSEITLRSTRVVTVDGRMLAVPNSTIINTTVASYTNFPNLRLDIDMTIGVNENVARVRTLLLGLVSNDPNFMTDPAPRVVVTALNDYNTALQLQVWINDEQSHLAQRFALRERAFVALVDAGVDMPFETLQIEPIKLVAD